jgi:hypothetical protein
MGHFMRENRDYEMSLAELATFIRVTQESRYRLDLIICGGEPLLWNHLREGLQMIRHAQISRRILLFTNAVNIARVDDAVMSCLSELRVSGYACNAANTTILQQRYPAKTKAVDRRVFYRQPAQALDGTRPCVCTNRECLYMNGKVYACPHGASVNDGLDRLADGTPLYVPLQAGYLAGLAAIRSAQEARLCTKCSSNIKVRKVTARFPKKDRALLS